MRIKYLLIVLWLFVATTTAESQSSPSGQTCGAASRCSQPPKCEVKKVSEERDTKNCIVRLPFGIQIPNHACMAERAANNQRIETQRAIAEQEYRQCLVAQDALIVQCDLKQTAWENCMSKIIPQFPPKAASDRRFLYNRCTRMNGRDEFTESCCTHLYQSDQQMLGVCRGNQPNPTQTIRISEKVTAHFGQIDDRGYLYVNGERKLYADGRPIDLNIAVYLQPGQNRVLFWLENLGGVWGANFSIHPGKLEPWSFSCHSKVPANENLPVLETGILLHVDTNGLLTKWDRIPTKALSAYALPKECMNN